MSDGSATGGSVSRPQRSRPKGSLSGLRRREAIEGYLFITPWILGFLMFSAGPMIGSLALSFTKYSIISPPEFCGLCNYEYAFKFDELFGGSLWRTVYYSIGNILIGVSLSLLAAILLNQKLKGTVFFRTFFFLPSLTPIVAAALLWQWIYQPDVGLINSSLKQIGIHGPGWIKSPEWAIPSLIIIALWMGIGGYRMIIFLAGLQGVPQELYEAANLDGANLWHRFRHVTLPLLSPTVFFNVVMGIIGSFSVFSVAFMATDGGPAFATWFYVLHLYNAAFKNFEMGYASALAWVFFVILLILTFIQLRLSKSWVYYEGEVK
jgi:multiple sugar transport system permease protein